MGNPTSTTSNSAANLSRCLSPSCRRTRRTTVATRLSTSAAVSERPITMLASAYGIEHGLTNWAAAYCTGLLIARRVLKKLGMDEDFAGVEEADGEYKLTEAGEDEDSRRPFKAFLDVGLAR